MGQVWKHSPYKAERLLMLLALADWANDDGYCSPSLAQMAYKARVSRQGAIQILQAFLDDKAIQLIERGGGKHRTSVYKLLPKNWTRQGAQTVNQVDRIEAPNSQPGGLYQNAKQSTPLTVSEAANSQRGGLFAAPNSPPEPGAYKELTVMGVCEDSQSKSTHTQRGARRAPVRRRGRSRHSFQTILQHTRKQKAAGAKIDPVAVAKARYDDGLLDEVITAEQAEPAAPCVASPDGMPGEFTEPCAKFLAACKERVNTKAFETWFAPLLVRQDGDLLVLRATEQGRDWLANNYADVLEEAFEASGCSGVRWV